MRLRVLPAIAVASFLGFFFASPAIAQIQSTTGNFAQNANNDQNKATLSGTLTDPSGAAVVGAQILVEPIDSTGTAKPVTIESGSDGKFRLELPPGRYRASVAHRSFEREVQEFTLTTGENRTWDIRFALRAASATVVVSATTEPMVADVSPYLVTVLSHEEITQRQELWLAPLLMSGGGVNIARQGGYGGITTMFLDGGNSNFTKVLIDGATANQPGGDIDLEGFDVSNLDKIEIVHGASSALYGSDAMTGVVQLFTHRGSTTTPAVTVFADGGTFGTGQGGGKVSGVAGGFDYSGAASYFSTDGQGTNDYFRNTALNGSAGYKFSDTDQIHLSIRNDDNDGGQPGQTFNPTPDSHIDQHNFFASLLWEFSTGEHWKNRLQGTDTYTRQDIFNPGFNTFNRFYRSGLEAQSSYVAAHGGISFGYVYEVENGQPGGPDHFRRNNQAGYAEGQYQLGRRVLVTAGMRVEDNASFGIRVVPRTGISYTARYGHDFWGTTRLRASYGMGIKEPTFVQSFEQDPCFPGNPNLKPERSTTVDAGIEQMLASARVKLTVTYFHNDFYDIVSFSEDFTPTPACPFGTGTFFNTDKARAFGAISSFEAKVTNWLRVLGNYTYDDTRVLAAPNAFDPTLAPGNRLFHRPLNAANLVVNAKIRSMNWNVSGTYVGRATDSDFFGLGITSSPSWVRFDITGIVPIRYGLSATAHVENLFNRQYEDAVGYPALGRNFRLGVKYVWGGE